MTAEAIVDSYKGPMHPGGSSGPSLLPPDVRPRRVRLLRTLRPVGRLVPAGLPVLVAGVAAAVVSTTLLVPVTVLAVWWGMHLTSHPRRLGDSAPRPAVTLHRAAAALGAATVVVVVGGLPQAALAEAMVVVAAGAGGSLTSPLLVRARPRRVLVVADRAHLGQLARWSRETGLEVVGAVPVEPPVTRSDLAATVTHQVERLGAQAVVVLPSASVGPADVRRLGWALEDGPASLAVCPAVGAVAPRRLVASKAGAHTLVEIAPSRAPVHVRVAKCTLDRVGAALLLLLLGPLLLALLALVRLDSRGPAIFAQTRVGRDGALFTLYKLRTMQVDSEQLKAELLDLAEDNDVLFKIRRDPRVTRVGRLLRRTSLDELPQLVNVLRGEMSLVGPRPALPEEVALYDETARRRLAVRPGLTGLWQVSGRADLDWESAVSLDVSYTDNVSLTDDLRICLRTLGAVTSGRGAY